LLVCFLVFLGSVYFGVPSNACANGTTSNVDSGATLTHAGTALAYTCSADGDTDRDSAYTDAAASNGVE
jgi:hypothetical protein